MIASGRPVVRSGFVAARGIWWVVLVGAVLRITALGHGELWSDEGYSALLSREPVAGILRELSRDSSPPLYYVLLHLWRSLAGIDAAAMRALSAVAGTAAVYACYRLGAAMFNHQVGVRAALLLAVSPLHLYYSQEARPYSLFLLFAVSALLGLRWLIEGRVAAGAACYCGATILAAYTHNYGLFLLAPLAAAVAAGRLRFDLAAVCAVVVAAAYLPWAPVLLQQIETGAARWTERIWRDTPPSLALIKSFGAFSIGGAVPPYVPIGLQRRTPWVHPIAYMLFGVLALRALVPSSARMQAGRQVAGWTLLLLGVPYLISFVIPVYVVGRYDVVGLPLFLMLCAAGADGLDRRQTTIAGALVLALAAGSLVAYYTREPLSGAERQASTILTNSGPDDAVLAVGFTRNAIEYYVREGGGAMGFYSFPSSLGAHRGWLDERELENRDAVALDAARLARTLGERHRSGGRLWIVHSRLLGDAATVLLESVNREFTPTPCPDGAEAIGLSCWALRAGRPH